MSQCALDRMLLEVLPEQVKNAGMVDAGVVVFDVGVKYKGMREHIFCYFPRRAL